MHRRRFGRKLAQLGVLVGLSSWRASWLAAAERWWSPAPGERGLDSARGDRRVFLVGADLENAQRARHLTAVGVPVTLFDMRPLGPESSPLNPSHAHLTAASDTGLLTIHAQHRVLGIAHSARGYVLRVRESDDEGNLIYEGDHRCTEVFLARGALRDLRDAATRGYPMHVG